MQKKIATTQLRLGMYVSRLSGAWLDHPFWKRAFLLTEQKQLDLIRSNAIREVWIDTSRGLDVPADESPADEGSADDGAIDDSALETLIATSLLATVGAEESSLSTMAEELDRAGRIIVSARGAMKSLLDDARLGQALDARECMPVVEEITASIDRNAEAFVSLARLKTSDDYTYMHSVAVCALMVALSRKLGLPEAMTRDAGLAGLLHDVGKVKMPLEILNKPGALTSEEFTVIRRHPQAGYDLLQQASGVTDGARDVCLHHHEKMNGSGYPFGLPGERISLLARMGAVCDVYDAITSNRAYKVGWDPSSSIQKMAQWSREGHFDDHVLQAFVQSIGIYPIGSLVRLASGRLAVVVDQTPANLLLPVVKTILVAETRERCAPEVIDLSSVGRAERIVAREKPEAWGLVDIDDHWRQPATAATAT